MKFDVMLMAVIAPLLWIIMWQLLRKYRVIRSWWLRIVTVATWMLSGDWLLSRGINAHIPGILELVFMPLTPFRAAAQYARGIHPESKVYYEAFGMVVGFLILFHCVSIVQFLFQRAPEPPAEDGPQAPQDEAGSVSAPAPAH
jgi:hypothetical protein